MKKHIKTGSGLPINKMVAQSKSMPSPMAYIEKQMSSAEKLKIESLRTRVQLSLVAIEAHTLGQTDHQVLNTINEGLVKIADDLKKFE